MFNPRRTTMAIAKPLDKSQWLKDKLADACTLCSREFSVILRRHHCRICGLIYCGTCSQIRHSSPYNGVRVCDGCWRIAIRSATEPKSHPSEKLRRPSLLEGSSGCPTHAALLDRLRVAEMLATKRGDLAEKLRKDLAAAKAAGKLVTKQLEAALRKHQSDKQAWAASGSVMDGASVGGGDDFTIASRQSLGTRFTQAGMERQASNPSHVTWDGLSGVFSARTGDLPAQPTGHVCDTDVVMLVRDGPLGLKLGPCRDVGLWALMIESIDESDPFSQAVSFNKEHDPDACCGILKPGMVLVGIAGQSLRNISADGVWHLIKTTPRPTQMRFRLISLEQLRFRFNELQSRFSSLAMRSELNEEILRQDAISAQLQRKALAKKLKVVASSFKDMQRRYSEALATIKTLRAENHHLLHQRDELDMRLSFVGSPSVPAPGGVSNGFTGPPSTRPGQTVDRMTEEKYLQQVASARAETEVVRGMLNDALRDRAEKDKEICRLRESLADSETHVKDIQSEYELLQTLMFPGNEDPKRARLVRAASTFPGSQLSVDPQAAWTLYNQERRQRVLVEDQLSKAIQKCTLLEAQFRDVFEKFTKLQGRLTVLGGGAGTMSQTTDASAMRTPVLKPALPPQTAARLDDDEDTPSPLIEKHVEPVVVTKQKGKSLFKSKATLAGRMSRRFKTPPVFEGAAAAGTSQLSLGSALTGESKRTESGSESDQADNSGSEAENVGSDDDLSGSPQTQVAVGRRGPSAAVLAEAKRCLDEEVVLARTFRKSSRDDGSWIRMPWKHRYVTVGYDTFMWYERESDTHPRGSQPLYCIERVVALDYTEIGKDNAFLVKIPKQSIFLVAPDDVIRREWVDVLQAAIDLSKQARFTKNALNTSQASLQTSSVGFASPAAASHPNTSRIVDSDASDVDDP